MSLRTLVSSTLVNMYLSGTSERVWTYCGQTKTKYVLYLAWTNSKIERFHDFTFKDRIFSRLCSKICCGQVPMTTYVPAPLLIHNMFQKCTYISLMRISRLLNGPIITKMTHPLRRKMKIRRKEQMTSVLGIQLFYKWTKEPCSSLF